MIHNAFSFDKWSKLIPPMERRPVETEPVEAEKEPASQYFRRLKRVSSSLQFGGAIVTSPADLLQVERARRTVWKTPPKVHRKADVFVFNSGDSNSRIVTKFGGLPAWPRNRPWPMHKGRPCRYVAQLSFVDSLDIVSVCLPGDIALFFGYPETDMQELKSGTIPGLHIEWASSRANSDWIMPGDVFGVSGIEPCFGEIYRTFDCTSGEDQFADKFLSPDKIPIWHATKIGGCEPLIQDRHKGDFLCCLSSINPVRNEAYPFINESQPVSYGERRFFMLGDCGFVICNVSKKRVSCFASQY